MKPEHIITIDTPLCIRCGLCGRDCPHRVINITIISAEVTTQNCLKCGHCVAICPQNAVSISGYEDSPELITGDMKLEPEALISLIKGRRSIRQFTNQDVPSEIVSRIIEAGRYTPTAMNKQDVSYVVL